jgi:DNA-binding CsgD family transcriptional regulator
VDERARAALADLIRAEVRTALCPDFERIESELRDLHHRLVTLEHLAGVPAGPLGATDRRRKVVELHSQGHSARAIARLVSCSRETVLRDLKAATVEPPTLVAGLDGRMRPHRRANGRLPAG